VPHILLALDEAQEVMQFKPDDHMQCSLYNDWILIAYNDGIEALLPASHTPP